MRKLFICSCLAAMFVSTSFAVSFKNTANGVWNSGITTGNVLLAGGASDDNYKLIKLPTGCAGAACQETATPGDLFGPNSYVVLGPNGSFPLVPGAWSLQNDTSNGPNSSQWIGPRANQNNPVVGGTTFPNVEVYASDTDFYVYRMVFNLTALGLSPVGANISLAWLSDNSNAPAFSPTLSSHIRLCAIASASDPVCDVSTMVANSGNGGQSAGSLTPVSINSGFTGGLMALDFVVYNSVIGAGLNPSGLRVVINSAEATSVVPEPATLGLMSLALIGMGLYSRRKR